MKLLVNAPSGAQELIEVFDGGGYFDSSRVVWDERTDGELPEITLGGMVRSGGSLVYSAERKAQHDAAIAPKVPQIVTRRQAKQALRKTLAADGFTLLSKVQPAIDAITDAMERDLMQIEWDESLEFHRTRPSLIKLATAIGLDSAATDELFILAATL